MVSPDVAENKMRCSPGSQAIGASQSCPKGGVRRCFRNAPSADVFTIGSPLIGTIHQSTLTVGPSWVFGLPFRSNRLESGTQTGQNVAGRVVCTDLASPTLAGSSE